MANFKKFSSPNLSINSVENNLGLGFKPAVVDSKLFNTRPCTNFIYKITKPNGLNLDFKKINKDTLLLSQGTKKSKIAIRLNQLESLNCKIEFQQIQFDNLQLNLKLIDSQLPEILAYLIYSKFKNGKSKLTDLPQEIKTQNPLGFDVSKGHPFYKINFLTLGNSFNANGDGSHYATATFQNYGCHKKPRNQR